MCFSTSASFISAPVLTAAGAISLKSFEKKNQKLFVAIPLIFGTQQFLEGLPSLALPDAENNEAISALTLTFLFFAQVILILRHIPFCKFAK